MKEPHNFHGGMDGDTVRSFVHAIDTYFGLTSIINEQTRYKFASLLLIKDAENWYGTKNYTSNDTWGTPKSNLLSQFKPFDYDRLNHKAFDQCRERGSDVSK